MFKKFTIWFTGLLIIPITCLILGFIFDLQGKSAGFLYVGMGITIASIYVRIRFERLKRQPHYKRDQHISDQMLKHYQDAGMSDAEIDFFRETMQQAEAQIKVLAANMQALPKLKAIDLNHDTTKVSQSLFRAIVQDPKRLHNAGDFLYRHLPSINELTRKYIEINHHEVKTADTYLVLDKSAEAIDALSQQIKADYTSFVAEDVDDLDTEVSFANQQITPDHKEEH